MLLIAACEGEYNWILLIWMVISIIRSVPKSRLYIDTSVSNVLKPQANSVFLQSRLYSLTDCFRLYNVFNAFATLPLGKYPSGSLR